MPEERVSDWIRGTESGRSRVPEPDQSDRDQPLLV